MRRVLLQTPKDAKDAKVNRSELSGPFIYWVNLSSGSSRSFSRVSRIWRSQFLFPDPRTRSPFKTRSSIRQPRWCSSACNVRTTACAQALMRSGWSSTQLPNASSHTTPGPASRPFLQAKQVRRLTSDDQVTRRLRLTRRPRAYLPIAIPS